MKKITAILPRTTIKGGTETAYGFIPHAPYTLANGQKILAPVLLEMHGKRKLMMTEKDSESLPVPVRTRRGYMHALPGRGSFEHVASS